MSRNYQNSRACTSAGPRVAMPETVGVAMAEIVEGMQEGLLALAAGAGLQVMGTIMEQDALRAAVVRVFAHPVIAWCQRHKIRNVGDRLPDHVAAAVANRMRAAYHAETALVAQAQLEALARELDRTHPGAAGSLREGMDETLTVLRLGVPPGCHRPWPAPFAVRTASSR